MLHMGSDIALDDGKQRRIHNVELSTAVVSVWRQRQRNIVLWVCLLEKRLPA